MKTIRPGALIAQLLLILPAALFMISLVVRAAGPMQYEPAHTAQQIIMWYSGRLWTLWILLTALPLAVLGIGCLVLLSQWSNGRGSVPLLSAMLRSRTTMLVAMLTLGSAIILLIVAAHVLMN